MDSIQTEYINIGAGKFVRTHCHQKMFNNELNIEILFILFDIFISPKLPEKAILKIGRIIQESAQMVLDGELDAEMRSDYIKGAVKEYLEPR